MKITSAPRSLASLPALVLVLAACSNVPPPAACNPNAETFETDVLPRVERYCGACHGETPNFGAPVSLTSYAELVAPDATGGSRLSDHVAARILDGTMPPIGMPRMPLPDAQAIVSWATCGAEQALPLEGLVSSAPPFLASEAAPAGLETLDLLANEHPVAPEVRDDYRCFAFDVDLPADRFIRRFEMVYDETRVLHHLILLRDPERSTALGSFDCYGGGGMPPSSQYLYAWAPGQSAIEFPEGGLRVSPGERFIVQIHYNNGTRIPEVRDSSGVRLYLGPTEGTEYGMLAIGPVDFELPPRATTPVSSRCTIREDSRLLAGMPHMHQVGSEFRQSIVRDDGSEESLVELTGWSFESQLFYLFDAELRRGDVIETTCTYRNMSGEVVESGEDTTDEMCFDFAYVTPPPHDRYCDDGDADRPTDVTYVPGECLASDAPRDAPPLVRGTWAEAEAPELPPAGALEDGTWLLDGIEFRVTGTATPVGSIDLEETYVLGRGRAITSRGSLTLDVTTDPVVVIGALRFGGAEPQSFTVELAANGTVSAPTCGTPEGTPRAWGQDRDTLTIEVASDAVPGQTVSERYRFRRVL